MNKVLNACLVLFSMASSLLAADEARIFAEGNKAYQEKDFAKAIKIYEELMQAGWNSPDLEYNLANAWYRNGSIGRAVLHYERAILCKPNHSEAKKNLAFLQSKIPDDIEPLPEFFIAKWWKEARLILPATGMGITGLAIWWLGFAALGAWVLCIPKWQKKWSLTTGITLILLSLLPISLALSRVVFEQNTQQAILIQKSAILHSAPDETSSEILTLDEGLKMEQVEYLQGWWQVRLPNGEVGWLPEQAIEKI